jgi:hypothetical protein
MRVNSPAVRIFPPRNGCFRYILYISSFESKRYCCGRGSCFLRSQAGLKPFLAMLRVGHRDLPVFFDELNDAFEGHDAEEYGRIAGAIRALLARHDGKDEAELYPLAQTR